MSWIILLFLALTAKASETNPKPNVKKVSFANAEKEATFGDLLSTYEPQPVFFERIATCGIFNCGEGYQMVEDVTVNTNIELSLGEEYLPVGPDTYGPLLVHQALLTFTVTQDGIQYPLSRFPVRVKTVAEKRLVYHLNEERGYVQIAALKPHKSARFFTNSRGQLRLSAVVREDDLSMEHLLFQTIDRPKSWNVIVLELPVIDKLSKLDASIVKEANPELSDEKAEMVAQKVSSLFDYVKLRQSMVLSKSRSLHLYDTALLSKKSLKKGFFSWETAITEFTKGLDQLNIQRSFEPMKWIKQGVIGAFKLVAKLFRLVGTTLVTVLNKLKSIVNWSAVIRTQRGFYEVFNAMASHSTALLLENKANVVETLTKSAKKQDNEQFMSILDVFKITPETSEYVEQVKKPHVQFGFTLDSATASLNKAQPILDGQTESLKNRVLHVANSLPDKSQLKDERAIAATNDILDCSSRLKSMSRHSKSIFGELVHIIKSAYLVVLSVVGLAIDSALYLLGAVINLVWFLLTLPLKVWPFNKVWSSISDSSEVNAFTLLTLGPAAIYTYTHIFLNRGKEPFPMELNVAQPIADLTNKGLISVNGEKRSLLSTIGLGLAIFAKATIFLIMSVLIIGSMAILLTSPFGLAWILYLLLVGCIYSEDL